jgi:hypothetical protein
MGSVDRASYGNAVPPHRSQDALVVVRLVGTDPGGHVLVIDDRDFLYEPDPQRAGPGRPGVGEVEDRLRRIVLDYVAWLAASH